VVQPWQQARLLISSARSKTADSGYLQHPVFTTKFLRKIYFEQDSTYSFELATITWLGKL
jgi:hypothetical protein